jgi:ABC-type nitrate/sulfonate/bicarbonate transport system ATPase subunit
MAEPAVAAVPILRVDALGKAFPAAGRSVRALDGLSLDIAAGEIVCLVGTSGCGKSTLLNILAGFESPSEGRVLLDGLDLAGPGADRGVVFQSDNLFSWLTVRGNVEFPLRLAVNRGAREALAGRVDALIDQVGLSEFRDAYPKQLSGGMRQRAAIARALVNRPRILLMDEPFGALDAQTRESMQILLLEVARASRATILFVTHDVEEAVFLGDRVVVMKAHPGRIVWEGEVDLPRPRAPSLKLDPAFSRIRREIVEQVH